MPLKHLQILRRPWLDGIRKSRLENQPWWVFWSLMAFGGRSMPKIGASKRPPSIGSCLCQGSPSSERSAHCHFPRICLQSVQWHFRENIVAEAAVAHWRERRRGK
jgi:hypothetical protein